MADILPRSGKAVREAEAADIPAIAKLYDEIEPDEPLGLERYRKWWSWLHLENPQTRKLALAAFGPDGACLGHVSAIAFPFSVDGEEVPAGFSCQLMVAESRRKTMLYPSLISALFKAYPKTGSAFLYSTVVRPRVLKGNLAVGFKKGPQIAVFARPYRSMPLLRRYLKGWAGLAAPAAPIADQILKIGRGASRDIAVETIERFPESVDALWERIRGALGLAAVRRAEFLNWRFFGDSGRDYGVFLAMRAGTPVGYVALREMQMREFRTLAVVDILFAPADREAADALLARVHAEAKVRKVDLVSAALNPDSPFRLYLARWGFLRTPEAFTLITHEPSHANRLAGREAADWHLTWFDHDYV